MDTNYDDIGDDPSSGDSNGERNSATKGFLRKGPWSAEEDAILLDYITKHGEGNWNACQRFSGLSRCGKSCRLRWVNQLRPNLKKGDFTPEEERVVIELHAKLGNKWSQMAAKLPGRTDNEIKNFWNTRVKRLERNGEPIYPPDVRIEIQSESQPSPNSGSVSNNLASPHSFIETINTELPEFKIECHPDPELYGSYTDPNSFYNTTIRNSLPRGRGPSHSFSCMSSSMHPQGLGPYGSFTNMSCLQGLSPNISSKGLNTSGNLSHMSPSMRSHDQRQEFDRIPHGLKDTASSLFIGHANFDASELQQQHPSNQLPPLPGICFRTDEPPLCIKPDSHTLINGNGNPSTSLAYFGSARSMGLPSLQRSVINYSFGAAPLSLGPFVHPPEVRPDQFQCTQLNRLDASMVENCYQTDPKEKTTDYFNGSFDFPLSDWEKEFPPICPSDPYSLAPLPEYLADEPQPNDDMLGPHIKTSDADTIQHSTIQNNNKDLYQFEPLGPDFSISELETVAPIAPMSPSEPNSFSHLDLLPGYFVDEQQPTDAMFGLHVGTSDANLHRLDSNMWINVDMLIPDCELSKEYVSLKVVSVHFKNMV